MRTPPPYVNPLKEELGQGGSDQSQARDRLHEGKQRASDFMTSTKLAVATVYRQCRERGSDVYQHLFSSARSLTRRMGGRAKQFKEDQPLQFLVGIAGTALVVGIVARVWRSRNHG